jgi:NADH-quinone oxidoreductase subunit M
MNGHLLSAVIAIPFLGAIAILFAPRQWAGILKTLALGVSLGELGLSLRLLEGSASDAGFRLVERSGWVASIGARWHVGIDGVSLFLVLLTTAITPICLLASWKPIQSRVKEYLFSFLFLEGAMVGTFVALDLFLFYVFWELMLVPMALLIGVWGSPGPARVRAAVKFFLYTMAGSVLMLVAILYLVVAYHGLSDHWSWDYLDLRRVVLPKTVQMWLFLAFAFAFAIKVPLWPLHTWLPDAHVEAPTAGSVVLAAVLLKMGTYGYLRFAMGLFPLAAHTAGPYVAGLAIVGILFGALVAWRQEDVKKLVAYSSVSHLGFVMLGLVANQERAVTGAVYQMLNHGVSTGALFLLVGVLYERRHTRAIRDFGGLARVMPWYATVFVIVTLSSIGLPGLNGFVGEFLILAGTFQAKETLGYSFLGMNDLLMPVLLTALAALGVIFGAVYMLSMVQRVFYGKVKNPENEGLPDLDRRETATLLPLVALAFVMGIFPNLFLSRIETSVSRVLSDYQVKLVASAADDSPRLIEIAPPDAAHVAPAEEAP